MESLFIPNNHSCMYQECYVSACRYIQRGSGCSIQKQSLLTLTLMMKEARVVRSCGHTVVPIALPNLPQPTTRTALKSPNIFELFRARPWIMAQWQKSAAAIDFSWNWLISRHFKVRINSWRWFTVERMSWNNYVGKTTLTPFSTCVDLANGRIKFLIFCMKLCPKGRRSDSRQGKSEKGGKLLMFRAKHVDNADFLRKFENQWDGNHMPYQSIFDYREHVGSSVWGILLSKRLISCSCKYGVLTETPCLHIETRTQKEIRQVN